MSTDQVSPNSSVDSVRPEIHPAVFVQTPFLPLGVFLEPAFLQSSNHARGESFGFGSHQNGESLLHLTCRNPLEVEPGKRRFQRSCFPNIRRNQGRSKGYCVSCPAPDLRNPERRLLRPPSESPVPVDTRFGSLLFSLGSSSVSRIAEGILPILLESYIPQLEF